MGVELFIMGIRKLRKKEVKELTGKTVIEMEKSQSPHPFLLNGWGLQRR